VVFAERWKYREALFPPEAMKNSMDLWGRDRYYGKLDAAGIPVFPRQSALKQLRFTKENNNLYALDFVADAWRDLSEALREMTSNGILYENSPWAAPQALKACDMALVDYRTYMVDNIFPVFVEEFLVSQKRSSSVRNFADFLTMFGTFAERILSRSGPITLSGFIESIYTSPRCSGLIIEIGDEPYDNDAIKMTKYIDGNFDLVKDILSHYGFSIDRRAPWRLIADIASPAMREYMQGVRPLYERPPKPPDMGDCGEPILNDSIAIDAFGYSALPGLETLRRHARGYPEFEDLQLTADNPKWSNSLFSQYYRSPAGADMEMIKVFLYMFYKGYVASDPFITYPIECFGGIEAFVYYRDEMRLSLQGLFYTVTTEGADVSIYGSKWNLVNYYKLRRIERGMRHGMAKQKQIIRDAINIFDFSSGTVPDRQFKALDYLNRLYVGPIIVSPLTLTTIDDIMGQLK